MAKLLHVVASPRGKESRTLKIAQALLDEWQKKSPGLVIDELNLFKTKLPDLTPLQIEGKARLMTGEPLEGQIQSEWRAIEKHIERFLSADIILISSPMWNFHVPYVLKHYLDVIVQPRYLFRYTEKGLEGLVRGKKLIVISTRGGDYGPGSPAHALDFQEPYLRAVFGFVGITDITFVNAQPMDSGGPEKRAQVLSEAIEKAKRAATS
ncbi:MAG: NAD(P)H-dependent oxidoreductase [Candidatus Omnitrophica bacterium]|nr:NAD(P)H-dependent oxidoreductase [Candidatus Omnitrophota bacterium]